MSNGKVPFKKNKGKECGNEWILSRCQATSPNIEETYDIKAILNKFSYE
jgi:hypothetical protein